MIIRSSFRAGVKTCFYRHVNSFEFETGENKVDKHDKSFFFPNNLFGIRVRVRVRVRTLTLTPENWQK
jgi:hypothetical protein